MVEFISAVPKMAASNISNAVEFYEQKLGFTKLFAFDDYGSVQRGAVENHFWLCGDRHIAENTACLVQVKDIETLYEECKAANIVHPNGLLATQSWGKKDFAVLDLDGNLITFFEPVKMTWREALTTAQQGAAPDRLQPCVSLASSLHFGLSAARVSLVVGPPPRVGR